MVRPWTANPLPPVRIWVPPMLYLVSTPIGNFEDITVRALRILKECNYILAEDTRVSGNLLSFHNIETPMHSFHKFNEREKENLIIKDLHEGKTIALISDAGTPTINDPGYRIIFRCQEECLLYTALPGPCALINSLVIGGVDSTQFQFLGFFPKKGCSKIASLALDYPGTTIFYLSPHNVTKCLESFPKDTLLCITREMTKTYEEVLKGTAEKLLLHFQTTPPRGEMVLLVTSEKKKSPLPFSEILSLLKEHLPEAKALRIAHKISGV